MRDHAARDEVVSALDVDVIDLGIVALVLENLYLAMTAFGIALYCVA